MLGHEVVEQTLFVTRASGRLKELQYDRALFFQVVLKARARVHASTTSDWHSIPSGWQNPAQGYNIFVGPAPSSRTGVGLSSPYHQRASIARQQKQHIGPLTTGNTSHIHPCNRVPDAETLLVKSRQSQTPYSPKGARLFRWSLPQS
jgi:hypothetical protein